jgi:hypothetical protein
MFLPLFIVLPIILGNSDVPPLTRFVSSKQKHYEPLTFDREVDPVTQSVIDSQFMNTFANGTTVTEAAKPGSIEPHTDLGSSYDVFQTLQPGLEGFLALPCNVVLNLEGRVGM